MPRFSRSSNRRCCARCLLPPTELVSLSAPGPKAGLEFLRPGGRLQDVFSYPMFRDLERVQTVLTGIAAHVPFGVALALSRTDEKQRGDARLRIVFPGARPAAGTRTTARSR